MNTSIKRNIHLGITICLLIILFDACLKSEVPIPSAPKELLAKATVPSIIYSNIKEIYLDASITKDLYKNRKLSFLWVCVGYPAVSGQPRIEHTEQFNTKVDSLMPGQYRFLLAVKDNLGNRAEASYDLEVLKDTLYGYIPIANAGPDQEIQAPNSAFFLDGSKTIFVNPWGRKLYYLWTVLSQPAGSLVVSISDHTKLETGAHDLVAGIYVFKLEVINEFGAKAYDTMQLTVKPDPLSGTIRIFENQVWIGGEDDVWGVLFVRIDIEEPGFFLYRNKNNMEVRIWDQVKSDWSDSNAFYWQASDYGLIIHYPLNDDPTIYYKEVGHKTRVMVKIL
jgi:hypothetical protein